LAGDPFAFAEAAQFLDFVKKLLEHPEVLV
jgi:hypothetical protein